MNTKRIFTWGAFIVVIGLIIWGLIAAENKASKESMNLLTPEEISETDHIKGNPNATVTLLEYGDFQCPACAIYYPVVEQLIQEASSTVRFVFRHFPIPGHAHAIPAARVSEAAGKQGKFWEMYAILYEKQKDWENLPDSKEVFEGYAESLGLDMEKFRTDRDSVEVDELISQSYKAGVKSKILGTPTFFINGKAIQSPQSYDEFKKLIEDAAK